MILKENKNLKVEMSKFLFSFQGSIKIEVHQKNNIETQQEMQLMSNQLIESIRNQGKDLHARYLGDQKHRSAETLESQRSFFLDIYPQIQQFTWSFFKMIADGKFSVNDQIKKQVAKSLLHGLLQISKELQRQNQRVISLEEEAGE